MNLYASVRDENGNIIIIRDSDYKTKREFKETLSMNGFKIRFVCIDDEDIIEYEAEKYEYKLQKARENAKYKREWLKANHTEAVKNAETVQEVKNAETVQEVKNAINTDNNISELTNSVIELDKLNKSNTRVSEKSKEFLKEFNTLSKNIIPKVIDNAIKNTNKALKNKKYKEMKIKSIRLSCFIYLVTSAIALFLQNFRKIPQDTNNFILGYTVNILGIEFNTQVINGRIIFIALGCFGFLVTNIYNVYDTVLDVYKCFCEYYSYFTWGYIKLIKKLYKNNEYIQNKKIHDLVFKMNGTYQEKIERGV